MKLPWFQRREEDEAPLHLKTGLWGEKHAERFLKKKGYKILGRRVRVGRRDELDLVVRPDRETLVFVEVKTRASSAFARPAAAVGKAKRRNLSRAASRYVARLRGPKPYVRFDIIEVVGEIGDKDPEINHIERAFTIDARYRIGG